MALQTHPLVCDMVTDFLGSNGSPPFLLGMPELPPVRPPEPPDPGGDGLRMDETLGELWDRFIVSICGFIGLCCTPPPSVDLVISVVEVEVAPFDLSAAPRLSLPALSSAAAM